jgi:hypothetical protein
MVLGSSLSPGIRVVKTLGWKPVLSSRIHKQPALAGVGVGLGEDLHRGDAVRATVERDEPVLEGLGRGLARQWGDVPA